MTGNAENMQADADFDPKVMSLWDHIGELRSRLIRSLLAIAALFLISLAFADSLINFLKVPLIDALPAGTNALHFTGPLDVFMANIKVSALMAMVVGAPIWLYQLWAFIEPALYPHERKYAVPFLTAAVAFFFAGLAFCFYIMLPMALKYLIGMGLEIGTPIITIADYLSLLLSLLFVFGLVFETPVVISLLAMLGVLDYETLTKHRKIVFVIILVVAAIVTPPDPISQLALAIPTYLMYEGSIIFVKYMVKERKKTSQSMT